MPILTVLNTFTLAETIVIGLLIVVLVRAVRRR